MIPNLNDLPPIPEDDHPLKKLVRPVLGVIFMLAVVGGVVWLFTVGIQKAANEEMNVMGGLRGVASELWTTGTAREIRLADPDLTTELARLRKLPGLAPRIVVIPAENRPGQAVASHELIYLKGDRTVISVRLYLDETEGQIDLLSFRTGPEFMEEDIQLR